MFKDIKDVFEKHAKHIKVDKQLMRQLELFKLKWINKNNDHIEFIGGNLLGVNPIRFSILDEEMLFVDILDIDQKRLKMDIDTVKGINPDWVVSSNETYQTLAWLMHKTVKSSLSKKDQEKMLLTLYLIFAYKVTSSLVSWYFKDYNVSTDIATMTYERLSKKYVIKRVNTWQEYFEYRANDIKPQGLHYKRIVNYNTINSIEMINDLQNRIRDTIKNIYRVMLDVKDSGDTIVSTSLVSEMEENKLSGILNRPDKYISYIKDVLPKEHDLIKTDLIHVTKSLIKNIDEKQLVDTLRYLSVKSLHNKTIVNDVENVLTLSIEYLIRKNNLGEYENNIESILLLLRGFWNASKIKNTVSIKKKMQTHCQHALNKKTKWVLVTTSTAVFLYIYLRAISKNIYN